MLNNRFGKLKPLEILKYKKNNKCRIHVKCLCDCGKIIIVQSPHLKSGHTKSCGCLRVEVISKHKKYGSPVYKTWTNIKRRCYDTKCKDYDDYGGRGIKVCQRWHDFENFYADMGERPENTSIERIDNNKNYSLSNCKWATSAEQASNKRIFKNNTSKYSGVSKSGSKWRASIQKNYKRHYLGRFSTPEEAHLAREVFIAAERQQSTI